MRRRNSIRAAGARSLARCLDTNSGLRRLDLSGQRLEGLGAAGAEALAQALRLNRCVHRLGCTGNRVSKVCKHRPTCGALGLGGNYSPWGHDAPVQGTVSIANVTAVHVHVSGRTLEELNVSSCGIAGSAAACFAGAIRAAGAVRPRTSLSGTFGRSVSGSDTQASDSLSSGGGGGALHVLSLSGNNIDAPTAKALIVAAAERPALTLNL